MNKEEIKEYQRKWREKNKEKIKEQKKEYNENNKDKIKGYKKKWYEKNRDKILEYRENNKEKIKEKNKKWYKKNRDKMSEYMKKYREKYHDKIVEKQREFYEKNKDKIKEYREKRIETVLLTNRVSLYFSREYFRYVSLENYLTIMKLKDDSLKMSIMVKLGKGTILEDEAVAMSGMVWSEEDQKQLNDYLKNRKERKRFSSKL